MHLLKIRRGMLTDRANEVFRQLLAFVLETADLTAPDRLALLFLRLWLDGFCACGGFSGSYSIA